MRRALIISVVLHMLFVSMMIGWSSVFRRWPRKIDVYQVELVSMPPPVQEVKMKENVPQPAPPVQQQDKKIPETTVKPKPKPVSDKAVSQKENQPQEKPRETASNQVKLDTEDFPYSYYLNLLRYRVQQNWNPPYQDTGGNQRLAVVVRFKILRSGRILAVEVETSSQRFLFDQAAMRAVYAAGPLPPLPDEFGGEELTVHIEFEAVW